MLETSPLLSNRYKRVEGGGNGNSSGNSINNKNNNNSRRQSSLRFLFFLTVISAIVTYFYDANLAPYNSADSPIQINQDILRATIAGSTVNEEYGYTLSDEQRALARSMNIEKRVSKLYYYEYLLCVGLCFLY